MGMDKKNNKEKNIQEKLKELVLVRVEVIPSNVKISVGSEGQFTKEQIINEIKQNSEIGKKMVEIELTYLRKLKEGIFYGSNVASN